MANYTRRRNSAEQKAQQKRFRRAQLYATKILADPLQRERYRRLAAERKCATNSLLISHFLTPPAVDRIVDAEYRGRPGDRIRVLASDDIEVVSVQITIRRADNTVLEQGPATREHEVWNYTTTAPAPSGQGVTIEASARDRPGNVAKAILAHLA